MRQGVVHEAAHDAIISFFEIADVLTSDVESFGDVQRIKIAANKAEGPFAGFVSFFDLFGNCFVAEILFRRFGWP